jgi:transposase
MGDQPFSRMRAVMPQPNDLSRSLVILDQNSTIIAIIEMSQSSWLVAGMLPGIERQPRKKLEPSPERLLYCIAGSMRRSGPAARSRGLRLPSKPAATASGWRAGLRRVASRSRDPCLECRGITGTLPGENRPARHRVAEARVLGWLRGERGHCSMARVRSRGGWPEVKWGAPSAPLNSSQTHLKFPDQAV